MLEKYIAENFNATALKMFYTVAKSKDAVLHFIEFLKVFQRLDNIFQRFFSTNQELCHPVW